MRDATLTSKTKRWRVERIAFSRITKLPFDGFLNAGSTVREIPNYSLRPLRILELAMHWKGLLPRLSIHQTMNNKQEDCIASQTQASSEAQSQCALVSWVERKSAYATYKLEPTRTASIGVALTPLAVYKQTSSRPRHELQRYRSSDHKRQVCSTFRFLF